MPWCRFLHVSCVWDSLLSFLDLWIYSFYQMWKNFNHIFEYFFCPLPPFRDSNYIYIRLFEFVQPQLVGDLCIFFSLFFFVCFILDNLSCYVSKLTLLQCVWSVITLIRCIFHQMSYFSSLDIQFGSFFYIFLFSR